MASSRSRRANAGSKMASLLNSEEADEFYKDTYGGFEEEENDNEFAYHSPVEDEVDSDFSIDENDEPKSDLEDDDDKARRVAKRGLGVQTKAYKEPKRNKDGSKMAPRKAASSFSNSTSLSMKSSGGGDLQRLPKPRPQFKAVLMTEFGRKYTRASTVNKTAETAKRQKERIAKAKKMLRKKAKSGGRKIERELTQEEILLEAEETEKLNIESLKKYEQMELENKRRAVRLTKRVVQGACIRYRSVAMPLISAQSSNTDNDKINVEEILDEADEVKSEASKSDHQEGCQERTFLTFSDHDTYRSAFPMSKRRLTQQKTCPITRLPAKYYDPVTQHPYANLQAFRILRETYYNQLEQKGDKSDPEVRKTYPIST